MNDNSPIRASGCVVYRHGDAGPEVLVVHRPKYDDWDFPKGKLEDGETDLECALRETLEETGFTGEVGDELPPDRYQVWDKDKVVRWWLLRQTGGRFQPNNEVDRILWVPVADAAELLSYTHAKSLLAFVPRES